KAIDVLAEPEKREAIKRFSNWPTIPQVYVGGKLIGGCDIVREMHARGELAPLLRAAGGGGRGRAPRAAAGRVPPGLGEPVFGELLVRAEGDVGVSGDVRAVPRGVGV